MSKQDYETPPELFLPLDMQYSFTIDAAAREDNKKVARFISPEQNALTTELVGERIWCNPPYANMAPWVARFIRWKWSGNIVVVLVQDKTDTVWFRDLWEHSDIVRFLHGRVQFIGGASTNMHGAVLFVLGLKLPERIVDIWDWRLE